MAAYKDIAMTILIMCPPVGLAAALLLWRDRRTLRPDMSATERRRAIENNTARTLNWWHLLVLAGILAALALNLGKLRYQPWWLVVEAAIPAFLVFRYYRKRSEESIKPVPRSGRSSFDVR